MSEFQDKDVSKWAVFQKSRPDPKSRWQKDIYYNYLNIPPILGCVRTEQI